MAPIGNDHRVIQIHPTLRCNLRCKHCYSTSSPDQTGALRADVLMQALTDARTEGFNVVGFAGGEPLMYPDLTEVMACAKLAGMIVSITTNGLLLNTAMLATLRDHADLIAISLDGVPESHNRMRAHARAFELMTRNLPALRDSGIPFGFIFTLTQYNLDELEWITEFSLQQGATLLQVHPLEEAGRAEHALAGSAPDARELTFGFIEIARLNKLYRGKITFQFDAADRKVVTEFPDRVLMGTPPQDVETATLSELVSSIIVEADGTLTPLQYGFTRHLAIADLNRERLRDGAHRWKRDAYPSFRRVCEAAHAALMRNTSDAMPFINWYGLMMRAAQSQRESDISFGAMMYSARPAF